MGYEDIYRKYNELRILQKLYDQAFGRWLLVAITYITIMNILCIFQAVVFSSLRFAFLGVILLVLEMSLIRINANVYETSKDVQKSWTTVPAPEWFHKWRKSFQPLSVRMGHFCFFDNGLRLTIMDCIATNAVNIIVTYSQG